MDYFYLFVVVVLFGLAISDLVVGVGNDAVNFLNSAIGSKVASFKTIMAVAILGVLIGATFSGGMMEIARKGLFFPEKFLFAEIMVIFLAVMFSDVILLDFFNTAGLPTSTTVSIVFELLGAALAVALYKCLEMGANLNEISNYINSAKALAILSGILVSVVIAFTAGMVIQYFVRMVFTFDWERTYRYFAAVWGGISISGITYFLLIKGAKGASFITPEMNAFITQNTHYIIIASFIGWTIFLQLLSSIFRINILKVIVLFGTFALAMAFAGNDLVNFIGVPLAGYESFKVLISTPSVHPDNLLMSSLNSAIKTPTFYLVIAGIIMSLTLCFSRKARSVVKTSVDLSRDSEGDERFASNALSRLIVRYSIFLGSLFRMVVPGRLQVTINRRFEHKETKEAKENRLKEKDKPAFDMVRASVNLVAASALIAMGTSLKLPLSTTYVTFMVAMGTALSDRAWGRESAVFRISGVMTVVSGWFFTGLFAFTLAFVIATVLFFGKVYAVVGMIIIAAYIITRTYSLHARKEKKEEADQIEMDLTTKAGVLEKINAKAVKLLSKTSLYLTKTVVFLKYENRDKLKKTLRETKDINKDVKEMRGKAPFVIKKFEDEYVSGHYYIQLLDYMKETAQAITKLQEEVLLYIDNNHPKINHEQWKDFKELGKEIGVFYLKAVKNLKKKEFNKYASLEKGAEELYDKIEKVAIRQIRMVKKDQISPRNSMLVTNILNEMRNIINFSLKFTKTLIKFHSAVNRF